MCATVCPSQALFFGTREEIEQLRPQSAPINQFQFGDQTITTKVNMMVPQAARRARRTSTSPRRWTSSREPRGDAAGCDRVGTAGHRDRRGAIRSPRWRSSDGRRAADPRARSTSRVDSPGREGLTGTAPPNVYAPPRDRETITIAPDSRPGGAAGLAAGLPDRLAPGPLRRAPRLHEVPGADERGVRRRPVLDRRRRAGSRSAARQPPVATIAGCRRPRRRRRR